MSLKLYYRNSTGSYVEVSASLDYTSPIRTIHNGKDGDLKVTELYLHNDSSPSLWYSNIAIRPRDLQDANPYGDVSYTETGWGIKLSPGGVEPTASEWEDLDWGEQISMDDIGSDSASDVATYYPFWYLITCPPNTNAQNKQDIVLDVLYTENAVT